MSGCNHVRDLPPIYRSIDGDIYLGNPVLCVNGVQGLGPEDALVDAGEEFESADSRYFEFQLLRRILDYDKVHRVESPIAESWTTLIQALCSGSYDEADDLMKQSRDLDESQRKQLYTTQTYRGLSALHIMLLFLKDPLQQYRLLHTAIDCGFQDLPDALGATAAERAMQLDISFPGTESPNPSYFPYDLLAPDGSKHRIEDAETAIRYYQVLYDRKDIQYKATVLDPEILYYLLLYLPNDFSVSAFNHDQIQRCEARYNIKIDEASRPQIAVANHTHTGLGDTALGLFAQEDIPKGQLLHCLHRSLGLSVKMDFIPDPGQEVLAPTPSNYAYHFLPYDQTVFEYKKHLLWPMIMIRPEDSADPIMFINDSGDKERNNSTWIHLFIQGLPTVCFVATQDIPKGYEIFGNYISDSPESGDNEGIWASTRGVEIQELPELAHPYI